MHRAERKGNSEPRQDRDCNENQDVLDSPGSQSGYAPEDRRDDNDHGDDRNERWGDASLHLDEANVLDDLED